MKKVIVSVLCFVLVVVTFAGCGGDKAPKGFSVGYAKADITPQESVPMSGMGSPKDRMSGVVLDPLYATCVACTDTDGTTVLMFGVDLLVINGSLFNEVRRAISEETGVPFDNIMFFASHNHNGTEQDVSEHPSVEKNNAMITQRCIQAAKDAMADRSPAKMYTTYTRPEGLNSVRHYVLNDGSYNGYRPSTYYNKMVGHVHKADNLMQVVKFTREEGKDVMLINWQSHYAIRHTGEDAANLTAITADYPGVIRNKLEEELDAYSCFFLGGAGNVQTSSPVPGGYVAESHVTHGEALAEHIIQATENFQEAELGKIQVKLDNLPATPKKGEQPLYAIGFGDFACVFAPFEIYDENAVAVREASKYKMTFYASCANCSDGNAYLPSAAGFSYPTYEAMGNKETPVEYSPFPQGTAETVQNMLIRMLDEIFTASGNEVKDKGENYLTPEFVPVSDGVEYTNPAPGDLTRIKEGDNGLYCFIMSADGKVKNMLAASKEIAEQVMNKTTMKLLFDERNVIVGISE